MLDWTDIPLGTEHEFNGKKLAWCATLHLTPAMVQKMGKEESTQAYVPTTV